MADSILRLKVDSQEYDNKLKRASESIQRYADGCRKAGGTLEYLDKGIEEYVRAIGQMDTTTKSAKGSLNEMTKSFTDLTVQYNKLTEAEKRSPFGVALKASLDELKGRINNSKQELDNINKSINGGGGLSGSLESLAGKFGLNVSELTKFGTIAGATTTALKVAKDAFFASEQNVDDWGRTVASAENIYDSFLQSLNNGDFSGFLSRLGEVINKAHDAYNALDELGTRMTIINPERTRLQARATELKAIIRREGANSAAGISAQAELRQLEGQLTKAFATESQLNMNAFKAQVDAKLKNAGISLGPKDYAFLMRTFSSDASYTAMRNAARGSVRREADLESGGSYRVDDRNLNQKLLDLFTDEWRREFSPYLNAAYSARGSAASAMLSDARYLKTGGGSSGGGSDSSGPSMLVNRFGSALENSLLDTSKLKEGKEMLSPYMMMLPEIKKNILDIKDADLGGALAEIGNKEVLDSIEAVTKRYEQQDKAANLAAQAAMNLGAALSGIEDPGLRAAGTVMSAIANIALGFAMASKQADAIGSGWGWIAWLAAGTAAMATTISTIHSLTGYAHGGIVSGNSYSGDNIPIMANAGEVVLTKAAQASLANHLENADAGGGMSMSRISGEQIYVTLNRYLKRTGQGELVTW